MTLGWEQDLIMGGSTELYILAVGALKAFGFGASTLSLFAMLCCSITPRVPIRFNQCAQQ
jgi:hypothetical protein